MKVLEIIIIGIALSMDALGITLSVGVSNSIKQKKKKQYIISFAFFQFLLTFIGGALGYFCDNYVVKISDTYGGIVIGVIGILMVIDGMKEKEESILTKNSMVILLGISVSIDAMVIGFSAFNKITLITLIILYSILIGLITLFICTMGYFLCKYIKKIDFIQKYADYLGGIALIIFAIKIIFF